MIKRFQIGDFKFELNMSEGIVPPANFMLFEKEDIVPEYTYHIRLGAEFPKISGIRKAFREDLLVYEDEGLESRMIGVKGTPGYYACYRELSAIEADVCLDPERLKSLNIDPVFTSLLALERRQLLKEAFVLHCAFVEYKGEAILFSAPSETGKTTQANLWEKYNGASTVNGDRALIQQIDDKWIARGWPVCGSSEVCHHKDVPIRAIVMLSQGKSDQVEKLSPMKAFTQVYSQVTINRWNVKSNTHGMDLIEAMITRIPVWHLSCTISENAVRVLENVLYPMEEK